MPHHTSELTPFGDPEAQDDMPTGTSMKFRLTPQSHRTRSQSSDSEFSQDSSTLKEPLHTELEGEVTAGVEAEQATTPDWGGICLGLFPAWRLQVEATPPSRGLPKHHPSAAFGSCLGDDKLKPQTWITKTNPK